MAAPCILLVDDDLNIQKLLESALLQNGYRVIKATTGEEALEKLRDQDIALILLDVILPGKDGLEVLKTIRGSQQFKYIPVIMLTSRDSEIDHVVGLELGADDYVGKPIRYHELIARIKAVLRRTAGDGTSYTGKKTVIGDMIIDSASRTVHLKGQELSLSFLEYELLSLLAKKPGKVFTREEMLTAIWSEECYSETRTIDVHIRRIRKKMEIAGESNVIIDTVRNVGYRLKTL